MARNKPPVQPSCPYCGAAAVLKPDSAVYARSYGGHVWMCAPCQAWVGCHRNSPRHAPLGRLARADLRALKIIAHARFDPLWMAAVRIRGWSRSRARLAAYRWLAGQMGLTVAQTHIGHFDEAQTRQAIAACEAVMHRSTGPPVKILCGPVDSVDKNRLPLQNQQPP